MKRAHVLSGMRVAGYHNDNATFTRLFIENRVSRAVADLQFQAGAKMKSAGVGCACPSCKREKEKQAAAAPAAAE